MSLALAALAGEQARYRRHAAPLPAIASPPARWRGVLLSLAGQAVLADYAGMDSVIPMPAVSAIPGTRAFVLGVATWQGALLPVLCGDLLCASERNGGRREHCLVIRQPGFHFAITLSRVHGPVSLPVDDYRDSLPADCLFPGWCRGSYAVAGQPTPILDIARLLADRVFSDTALLSGTTAPEGVSP